MYGSNNDAIFKKEESIKTFKILGLINNKWVKFHILLNVRSTVKVCQIIPIFFILINIAEENLSLNFILWKKKWNNRTKWN